MSNIRNIRWTDNGLNTWIFLNELRMIDYYDNNACSWLDVRTIISKSQMTSNRIKETSRVIDEKDDTLVASVYRCLMTEMDLNAVNWISYNRNCLNDSIQRTIFNHWTYLFNQLQRRTSRNWRIQNVVEQYREDIEKYNQ